MKKTAQYRQQIQSKRAQVSAMQFNKKAIAVYVAMIIASNGAEANPIGGEFAQGMGSISNAVGLTTIQQTTQQAIVNWQSFGSNAGEVIKFVQPNANAAILNRVVGNLPSNLNGLLEGNGRVYLVNPNGIVLGANGVINVNGGFVASTQGISDSAFMQGGALTFSGDNAGNIQILGKISSAQGDIVIIAPKTEIAAGATLQAGQNIQLIAANEVQLSNGKLTVTPKLSDAGQLTVAGTLEAAKVQLEAHNNNLGALAINTTGTIRANGTQTNPDGSVSIMAYGEGSNIKVSGSIKANSSDTNNNNVQPNMGGRIVIGRNEDTGVLAASTDIRGATLQSQGGFVETSGASLLSDNVNIQADQWLIDPYDIEITDSANALSAGYTTKITTQTLQSALNNGTDVVIQTTASGPATGVSVDTTGTSGGTGNILVTTAIVKNADTTSGADPNASLTLKADNNIVLNAGISATSGKLDITLDAANTTSTGKIDINGVLTSNGGNINARTRGTGAITQISSVNAGSTGNVIYQTNGGQILLRGASTLSGKNASLDSTGGQIDATTGVITAGSANTGSLAGIYIYNANVNLSGNLYALGVSNSSTGIQINQSGTGALGPLAQVKAANIWMSGSSNSSLGLLAFNGSLIQATAGSVELVSTSATGAHAMSVEDYSQIKATGDITLRAANKDINITNPNGSVTTTGSGATIAVVADGINITGVISAANGTVALQNYTAGTAVALGGSDAAGVLGISAAELEKITASKTVVGSSTAGNVSVSITSSTDANGNLGLKTAGNVSLTGNLTVGTTGTKNLSIDATGANSTVSSAGNITAAGLKLSGANAAVSLSNHTHQINTLSANVKSLNFANGKALLVGQVDGQTGLQVTDVANLTVAGAVTTDASTNATIAGGSLYADATTIGTSGQHLQTNVSNLYATAAGDTYITNASAVTVAAATTAANGKIDISTTGGTLKVDTVNGHNGIIAHGTGSITLSGHNTAASGDGIEIRQHIITTGDISLTGINDASVSPSNRTYAGILNVADVRGNNITMAATASHTSANVLGYYGAGGSLYASGTLTATTVSNGGGAGFYMWGGTTQSGTGMTITGSSNTNVGVKIEHTATVTNTTSGTLSIIATSGDFVTGTGNNAITNTGAINLKAGQNASSAGGFNGAYLTVMQNGNAATTVQTTGTGNLTSPKIVNNGTGDVVIAAGSDLLAGNGAGGQVRFATGNTITNNNGRTYIYTGNVADSANMSDLNPAFGDMVLLGVGQNTKSNAAYNERIANTSAAMQVMYRENIKVEIPGAYGKNALSNDVILLTPITFGFGVVGGATAAGGEVEGSCDAWSQRAGAGSISVVSLLKPSYMGLRTAKTDTMDAMAGAQTTGSTLDAGDNPCASAALVNRQASL